MIYEIALAGLFGLVLGSGATFAYLVMQGIWAGKAEQKASEELVKVLGAAVDVGSLVTVTKRKKRKRNEDKVPPNETE